MARRPRGLTPEESELWARIARTAQAMHKKPKPAPAPDAASKPVKPTLKPASSGHGTNAMRSKQTLPPAPQRRIDIAPTPAQRLAEQPVRMDHKLHKRMTKGKLLPDARLDLHGMTLAMAQPALVNFILSCRANQMRLVLVITGKGRGDHGPLPTRPGALRHIVPEWLRQPPLSTAVQQVTPAHFRHGGEGAYYVYLRKFS